MSEKNSENSKVEPTAAGLSRKDGLSLGISFLALLLSLTSLVWTRIDKTLESRAKETSSSFSAFELGRRTATAYWAHLLTNQGDQADIEKGRHVFIQFAKDAQQYAISLDIRQDVSELVGRCAVVNATSCLESPEVAIRNRIVGVSGVRTADTFTLAYRLSGLNFVSRAAGTDPAKLKAFRSDFMPHIVESNSLLQKLGYRKRIPVEFQSANAVTSAVQSALKEIAEVLDGDA